MSGVIGATAQRQAALFQEAVSKNIASPGSARAIHIMIELASFGLNATLRLWAENFLWEKLKITVLHDEIVAGPNGPIRPMQPPPLAA